MSRLLLLLLCLVGVPSAASAQHDHPASAAPQTEGNAPSTLSAEQVQQLLEGEGMGLARAAELHGYPGPKHVLDLAKELQLTSGQQQRIAAIREHILTEARRRGRAIVDAERALDEAFRSGDINEIELASRVRSIATMQGELRLAHLAAHLEVKPLLSSEQLRRYVELRERTP